MRPLLLLFCAPLLVQCAEVPEPACEIFSPIEGEIVASEMTIFPDAILEAAELLQEWVSDDPSLVGFWGPINARIAGTRSYSVASEIASLKRLIAYQVSLEQAIANDGTPLVDMSDDRMCELLAASIASVDQGQSSEQFLANLDRIIDYFGPTYPYREDERVTQ